ncbi:MAG: S-methyl-5-thioribose-1-phosphate isomerase [Acidobacteria bacterium]|nr:S-methyl-5-thioribose-1-phosphate isomerase [Acidobacteriota bacterium]
MIEPIRFTADTLLLLDQRLLPEREEWLELRSTEDAIVAIRDLVVRGAPAIGVTAAYGLVLGARQLPKTRPEFDTGFAELCAAMCEARPTAINLAWAVDRLQQIVGKMPAAAVDEVLAALLAESERIQVADLDANRTMGRHGAALLGDQATVLTHCNAGALATAGYGTALGVVRAAVELGKKIQVLADETRPYLQGARLTAWELQRDDIPCTVIADNMSGYMMQTGAVDAVVVGSDRIAANGDVANKIGTYMVAVLAREHGIPFYVAAPTSTIDLGVANGTEIPIEERDGDEVVVIGGQRIAPVGISAAYPAFDVTPARLVDAIITEQGVARAPYTESLRAHCEAAALP